MTPRRDLARLQYQTALAIDRLHTPLVSQIGQSVRGNAVDGKITQETRTAVLRDVDAMLNAVYPKRRGAPSRLQTIIERQARKAALLPVAEAVGFMREHVPDELRAAMGDERLR